MVVTLTDHGQLSIPELVQRRLGLSEGMELDMRVVNNRIVLEPKKSKRKLDAIGISRPSFPTIGFDSAHERHNDSR